MLREGAGRAPPAQAAWTWSRKHLAPLLVGIRIRPWGLQHPQGPPAPLPAGQARSGAAGRGAGTSPTAAVREPATDAGMRSGGGVPLGLTCRGIFLLAVPLVRVEQGSALLRVVSGLFRGLGAARGGCVQGACIETGQGNLLHSPARQTLYHQVRKTAFFPGLPFPWSCQ